jgi:hypothetical protein
MVVKTMDEQEFCQGCNEKHNCQKVYEKLGNAGGPSIALKAVVAFLLPMIVFITALAACDKILAEAVSKTELRTVVSLLFALLVTSLMVLAIKLTR